MNKPLALLSLVAVSLTGCAGANIATSFRQTNSDGADVQTRCEAIDLRDNKEMNKLFTKYDGWRVLYISEYTTQNKHGTSGVVCFEHVKKS
jgi:hypothetical protein